MCTNSLIHFDNKNATDNSSSFFYCKFCFWNSKNYGISGSSIDELVRKNYDASHIVLKKLENY